MAPDPVAVEAPKKRRGWPKGVKRGPRVKPAETVPTVQAIEEVAAPIHVRVWLKGEAEPIEFGAADRGIENGFHVFTYPSERDRYRTTRVEFAITEIRRIEITEAAARKVYDFTRPAGLPEMPAAVPVSSGPKIHSAKESAIRMLQEQQKERIENLVGNIGTGVTVGGLGDSLG